MAQSGNLLILLPSVLKEFQLQTQPKPNQTFLFPSIGIPAGGGSISIGAAIGDAFGFFKQNALGCLVWLILHPILGATGIGSFLIPLIGVNLFICAKRFQEIGKKWIWEISQFR